MKKLIIVLIVLAAFFVFAYNLLNNEVQEVVTEYDGDEYCFTGAFIDVKPTVKDILKFKTDYGKKPYFVLIFVDWEKYPDLGSVKNILEQGCVPFVSWEPWYAQTKGPIEYDKLLEGAYDEYINNFAVLVRAFKSTVFLRFAHEMNGNWYPWSGSKIGVDEYKRVYRYIKDIFDSNDVKNVKWVFAVNWENVPGIEANDFLNYYPGDTYVDYVGIDGYNWGDTQSWSRWMSFKDLFEKPYNRMLGNIKKPVLISEFASSGRGGDKAVWIQKALNEMKKMDQVKGFVVFNVNKEVDWKIDPRSAAGKEFSAALEDPYFKDSE